MVVSGRVNRMDTTRALRLCGRNAISCDNIPINSTTGPYDGMVRYGIGEAV